MSTSKAREVLGSGNHTVAGEEDAKKIRYDGDAVWELMKKYEKVIIAKAKTWIELPPTEENKEILLKEAMGRSGNLRAPSVGVGKHLVVGFNEAMYREIFG